MRRILVTGGAGFLGSFLCERLIERGDHVVCLDNLFTGSLENVAGLLEHPRFRFVEHDVTEPMSIGDVDQIYHLACPASPVHYQREPVRTIRTAVEGTSNVLELARATRARVAIASTSEVYGDPLEHPQVEAYWGNVNPVGPRACYDEGKRCAEALAVSYRRQFGVDARIARIFNTYGPRMQEDDGRVVSNFIVQALRGEPLTVYGPGTQTRSFCYVTDLIRGLVALMDVEHDDGPINLGNPHELTIGELAERIVALTGALTGSPAAIRRAPLPVDDPLRRRPDITRATRLLGWTPEVGIDDGLAATVAYFQAVSRRGESEARRSARSPR